MPLLFDPLEQAKMNLPAFATSLYRVHRTFSRPAYDFTTLNEANFPLRREQKSLLSDIFGEIPPSSSEDNFDEAIEQRRKDGVSIYVKLAVKDTVVTRELVREMNPDSSFAEFFPDRHKRLQRGDSHRRRRSRRSPEKLVVVPEWNIVSESNKAKTVLRNANEEFDVLNNNLPSIPDRMTNSTQSDLARNEIPLELSDEMLVNKSSDPSTEEAPMLVETPAPNQNDPDSMINSPPLTHSLKNHSHGLKEENHFFNEDCALLGKALYPPKKPVESIQPIVIANQADIRSRRSETCVIKLPVCSLSSSLKTATFHGRPLKIIRSGDLPPIISLTSHQPSSVMFDMTSTDGPRKKPEISHTVLDLPLPRFAYQIDRFTTKQSENGRRPGNDVIIKASDLEGAAVPKTPDLNVESICNKVVSTIAKLTPHVVSEGVSGYEQHLDIISDIINKLKTQNITAVSTGTEITATSGNNEFQFVAHKAAMETNKNEERSDVHPGSTCIHSMSDGHQPLPSPSQGIDDKQSPVDYDDLVLIVNQEEIDSQEEVVCYESGDKAERYSSRGPQSKDRIRDTTHSTSVTRHRHRHHRSSHYRSSHHRSISIAEKQHLLRARSFVKDVIADVNLALKIDERTPDQVIELLTQIRWNCCDYLDSTEADAV